MERKYLETKIPVGDIPEALQQGAIIVSEPFARRHDVPSMNWNLKILTDQGLRIFPIVGVYYDYSSPQGTVTMNLDTFRKYWNDQAVTASAIRLREGIHLETEVDRLKKELSNEQAINIRANRSLRNEVMKIFDRTFAITGALQLLATVVAFIGILSSLLSLELERKKEMGILRAVGLTVRQLRGLFYLETGLRGAVAGIFALPTGYILSLILVYIINKRSFGWTLQMHFDMVPFIEALIISIVAALLAGIYPAYRTSRSVISEA